jgi:hypothetical protein
MKQNKTRLVNGKMMGQRNTRREKAKPGQTRKNKTRPDTTRRSEESQDNTGQHTARKDQTRDKLRQPQDKT